MRSVDVRTRDGSEQAPDPDALAAWFADAAARHGDIASRGAAELGLGPLALAADGGAVTLRPFDGGVVVEPGDDGSAPLARMTDEALGDLACDRRSTIGLVLGDDVVMERGEASDLIEWEPALRALLDGRPVHADGDVDLSALDLAQPFTVDDDPATLNGFLAAAGFLHLRGVFTDAEMAAVSADIDDAAPRYSPDDGRSWWARTDSGDHRAVRLQEFDTESPALAALMADDRYQRLARLVPDDVVQNEITEALMKPVGVVEGISDVPWHKDCSLGGHSSMCCGLTVGISVTGAGPTTGMLCIVAGSHRANVAPLGLHPSLDLPVVELPTTTGDVTIHLSCTLHMSVPPSEGERRVVYTGFKQRPTGDDAWGVRSAVRRVREAAPGRIGTPDAKDEMGRVGDTAYDR